MKAFLGILFCFIAVQALQPEESTQHYTVAKKCQHKTKIDDRVLMQARQGKFSEDKKLKLFFVCFGKRVGILDKETGKINREKLEIRMNKILETPVLARKVMDECAKDYVDEEGNVLQERTAFMLFKCFYGTTNRKL